MDIKRNAAVATLVGALLSSGAGPALAEGDGRFGSAVEQAEASIRRAFKMEARRREERPKPAVRVMEDPGGRDGSPLRFQRTLAGLYRTMRPRFRAEFETKLDALFGGMSQDSPTVRDYAVLAILLKKALARYKGNLTYEELRALSLTQYEFEWTARQFGWDFDGRGEIPSGIRVTEHFPSLETPR